MTRRKLTRRQLLVPLGVIGVGGALGLRLTLDSRSVELDLTELNDLVGDLAALGRIYLERFPEEATLEALRSGLSASLAEAGAYAHDNDTLRTGLALAARDDFSRDETFEADRWLLSRTEGRLAALTVLLP